MNNAINLEFSSLPAETRDWILARSAKDRVPPQTVLERIADQQAKKEGFKPQIGVHLVVSSNTKAGA